ncbi:Uncharacterised protein [Mycobacteroides abscessus subsp. abscessus]|nr:Uncharacterised protein [Mycobacteroides abscessus subsp. abscessus]
MALQLRGDGAQTDAELRPGEFDGMPVLRSGEVQVAVGDDVPDVPDVPLDQGYQRGSGR